MCRRILILLALTLNLWAFSLSAKDSKVYYLVLGSFEKVNSAQEFLSNLPEGLDCAIFSAEENSHYVFNVSCGCFSDKKKAQQQLEQIESRYKRKLWIWDNDSEAKCIFRPINNQGELVNISVQ